MKSIVNSYSYPSEARNKARVPRLYDANIIIKVLPKTVRQAIRINEPARHDSTYLHSQHLEGRNKMIRSSKSSMAT